ncbi:MAG: septal ring lytic transglycosylase RlpA family protein [Clostridiales bacterium]|nr:septal ring lytic transglycosylase RlpA family protein [Clostridiales bacterium]
MESRRYRLAVGFRCCLIFICLGLAFISGCRVRPQYFPEGNVQTGEASWYGAEFHGRLTSSREIYDMNDLTAAHNTLPLGTYVIVTNLSNGRSVVVRINDRGPFVKGRVIDLSYAAARALDMIGPGTARVRIEVLPKASPPPSAPKFFVQVGSFIVKENAEALRRELEKNMAGVYITRFTTTQQVYYRVRIRAKTRESAQELARELAARGYTAIIFEDE